MQRDGLPHTIGGHQQFTCSTSASPEMVWSALTEPEQTKAFLYGLAAHSCWQVDAAIEFRYEQFRLEAQVMHVERPCRLSYVMAAGPEDPPTYVTWQIRTSPAGSTIRLQIDEAESADTVEEAEDVWLPVLAALQRHLES